MNADLYGVDYTSAFSIRLMAQFFATYVYNDVTLTIWQPCEKLTSFWDIWGQNSITVLSYL